MYEVRKKTKKHFKILNFAKASKSFSANGKLYFCLSPCISSLTFRYDIFMRKTIHSICSIIKMLHISCMCCSGLFVIHNAFKWSFFSFKFYKTCTNCRKYSKVFLLNFFSLQFDFGSTPTLCSISFLFIISNGCWRKRPSKPCSYYSNSNWVFLSFLWWAAQFCLFCLKDFFVLFVFVFLQNHFDYNFYRLFCLFAIWILGLICLCSTHRFWWFAIEQHKITSKEKVSIFRKKYKIDFLMCGWVLL